MLSIFKPAPHKARLPAAEIDPTYRRLRWQIFLGIFFGYAAYYLVRKNFALAMPYLVEQGFSRGDLGFALSGISIAYGFSKFIMGSVSDRSNPRVFLPVFLPAGLILARFSAGRVDSGRSSHVVYGLCTVGDIQHRRDVCAVVPLRLVPGDGVAAVRTYDGSLVVAERARRHCVGLELCA
ncbi:Phosphoglycerate transporter protein PgtP [Salmonella enterica subsp. enterica serovar Adelaide str. A4-669]|uniref:Phosphoglycerate transporter protein PgtP n=1 Tax=Salmonella enterica subsp. enterica serovar Adelaide str. A4-669 TaxID=913063 RepID=A0A6C8GRN3_SALET|nr:Phosphoglycerate transporter protein PgtP [Salmonella enterica subsp. enterica serovar Adelaide str. A4-669]